MTLKEKVRIYEGFFHQIQMHYAVTMDQGKVLDALNIIDAWSYAHRVGNGMNTDKEQQRIVITVTKRMKEYI